MKSIRLALMAAALLVAGSAFAKSTDGNTVHGPAWTCTLDGQVSGESVGAIVSVTKISGPAVIRCSSIDGSWTEENVNVEITGVGLGLGYAKITNARLRSLSFGAANGIDGAIGRYSLGLGTGATLVDLNVHAGIALSATKSGLSLDFALEGYEAQGLQLKLEAQFFEISRAQ